MKCVSCKKPADIKIIAPFCKDCFISHYERRVERLIKKYRLINKGDNILVAVSGGIDSLSCAHVLSKLREKYDFSMSILHLDVGIPECTNPRTENVVRVFCMQRDIPFIYYKFSEFLETDKNLEEISKKVRRPLCSTCGMLKRYLFNKIAREKGFNKIATGHCADDIARFFFKNCLGGNFDWIAKFKPITRGDDKTITRIRPLFEMLEKENLAYTTFNDIVVAGCSRCSYFLRDDQWNDMLNSIEEKIPDFKLGIVRGLEKVKIHYDNKEDVRYCKICGELTNQDICAVCRLKERVRNLA